MAFDPKTVPDDFVESLFQRPLHCSVAGCEGKVHAKGLCGHHYRRVWNGYGVERTRQKNTGTCEVDGCDEPSRRNGMCNTHSAYFRRHDTTEKQPWGDGRSRHQLRKVWHDWRYSKTGISTDWKNDFWKFVADVGKRPSKLHHLVTLQDGPIGPDNFCWQEKLVRHEGETESEHWARKWQRRIEQNPGIERARHYPRRFGISLEDYEHMFSKQNGLCAICNKPETASDPRYGRPRRLSLDHNHLTGKLRQLLCFRCNATIGRVEEDTELLRNMIDYIERHND